MQLDQAGDTITVHNDRVAVHRNFTLNFDVSSIDAEKRKQMFIAHLDDDLRPSHIRTYKKGTTFTARTKSLGKFTLATDTIPPKVRPRNFAPGKWLNNYQSLSLTISDDLSGIQSYDAFINGKWILMEYEPKKRMISYNFKDNTFSTTQCNLKVVVTDNVGNTTTFEETFYRN